MQTTIEKTFQVDQPIEKVWVFLSDPNRVVVCVPGAKITEKIDERNYRGAVSMKVGPVVTDFKGEITIDQLDEAHHEMVLTGTGQDVKGKGNANMKMTGRLRALDSGGTEVVSTMEVSVVGKLAQFGSRLFSDISNRMFDQFTDCFAERLQAAEAPEGAGAAEPHEPEPVKAVSVFFQAIWAAIRRFFRRITGRKAESQ